MSINVRTTTVNTPLSSNFISPTLSEPINVQNHSTLVTNETLRALLPYRSMDDDLIFYNINSIGFGLQLMPKESIDIQTINTILIQLNTNLPYDLHCSMVLHKHHYTSRDTHSNYRCHLFFSCSNVHHRHSLAIYRERIEAQLYKHNLRPIRIDSIYFLIFLRTLISPNLQTTEWPALLDIHQKPFNYIIPNPGTRFNQTI